MATQRSSRAARYSIAAAALLALAGSQARAADPDAQQQPDAQRQLLDEVRSLRAEVKDLKQKEAANEAATRAASAQSQADVAASIARVIHDADVHSSLLGDENFTAGWTPDRGFVVRSGDGNFLLHAGAFIQFRNVTNYVERTTAASHDEETQNGFETRRLKVILDGNLFNKDWTYQFIWNTTNGTGALTLDDAWVRYHIPGTNFGVRAGQIRNPFDHEQIVFATSNIAADRSFIDDVFAGGEGLIQGVEGSYGYDVPSDVHADVAFTDGQRTQNTDFQDYPTNNANYGAAARVEYKVMGDWNDYRDFTALNDKKDLLVVGAAVDYTEAGDTGQFQHVIDAQYEGTSGLSAYAAYLGRYVRDNQGLAGTDGGSATAKTSHDTYDSTLRAQAGYLVVKNVEPFVRYEFVHFDRAELPTTAVHSVVHIITAGANYYIYNNRIRLTVDGSYLPNGSPITDSGSDILATHGGNELMLRCQVQFAI